MTALLNPQRLRQIPRRFSWIDHRLVRDQHFQRVSLEAMAFYLFLVTVSDAKGISYYSQPSLMKHLRVGIARFMTLRQELIEADLIAWEHPIYQVLAFKQEEGQHD